MCASTNTPAPGMWHCAPPWLPHHYMSATAATERQYTTDTTADLDTKHHTATQPMANWKALLTAYTSRSVHLNIPIKYHVSVKMVIFVTQIVSLYPVTITSWEKLDEQWLILPQKYCSHCTVHYCHTERQMVAAHESEASSIVLLCIPKGKGLLLKTTVSDKSVLVLPVVQLSSLKIQN
jgi:hypothetical protein